MKFTCFVLFGSSLLLACGGVKTKEDSNYEKADPSDPYAAELIHKHIVGTTCSGAPACSENCGTSEGCSIVFPSGDKYCDTEYKNSNQQACAAYNNPSQGYCATWCPANPYTSM